MSQPGSARPPRIAEWLLALFIPADEAEPIAGDLMEEFSALAAERGFHFARRWYWQQTFNTVLYLTGAAFRAAPWLIAVVLAGQWSIGFGTRFSAHALEAFLEAHRYYALHPDAYLFWLKFPFETGRVLLCLAIGVSVAAMATRREMPAVASIALVQILLFATAAMAVVASRREWLDWFLAMGLWNSLCWMSLLAGGAIVRLRRQLSRPPLVKST